jgi:hypothetical protein
VRFLIGIVLVWNVQAGIVFILSPASFVHAYGLSGIPGEAAVRGFGVLFLMWNIPYLYAAIDPLRFRLGLVFALWMQFIGLLGESYIYFTLPLEEYILRSSVLRFILFDGAGLAILSLAFLLNRNIGERKQIEIR